MSIQTGRSSRLILTALLATLATAGSRAQVMSVEEAMRIPSPPADERIQYGPDPLQFGDLRLPEGPGPFPVAIVIHGGCWLSDYDIGYIGALAAALTDVGIATWTLEYRRVGDPGGGWPNTFLDVARGADHLWSLAENHRLDLERVLAVGHSAGGQLALWLAARPKLPASSPLHTPEPIPIAGVLGLAAAPDLEELHAAGVCDNVVDRLMGGSPAEAPERYAAASPSRMTPLGVRQALIGGELDENWFGVGKRYFEKALADGDDAELIVAPGSGHFEIVDPRSKVWPLVERTALSLLQPKIQPAPLGKSSSASTARLGAGVPGQALDAARTHMVHAALWPAGRVMVRGSTAFPAKLNASVVQV